MQLTRGREREREEEDIGSKPSPYGRAGRLSDYARKRARETGHDSNEENSLQRRGIKSAYSPVSNSPPRKKQEYLNYSLFLFFFNILFCFIYNRNNI